MLRKLYTLSIDGITRGFLISAAGQATQLSLGLISSVLLARALGRSDYGIYGVLAATTAIVGALADIGLTTTAAQQIAAAWPARPSFCQTRGRVYFWTKNAAAAFITLAGILFAPWLSEVILNASSTRDTLLISLTFLGVAATALSEGPRTLLRAARRFGRINVVIFVNAGLTALLALILATIGRLTVASALLVLGIGTSLVAFAVGARLLPLPLDIRLPTGASWQVEQKQLLRFSRWIAVSNVLHLITRQMDVILINRWQSAAAAGIYFLALSLSGKVELINHTQYTVLIPSAASVQKPSAIRNYLAAALKRNAVIALILLPVLFFVGPFVAFFYGAEFVPAVPLFRALFLVVLFDLFTLPVILLFLPLDRPDYLTIAEASQALLFVLLAFLLIPRLGAMGAVIAKGSAKATGFLVTLTLFQRLGRRRSR